ncbi:nucleotide exchange factor GrpE [Modestobacter sp. Leaf380]|uniref:nucleotide exchange factor GrpE n=1 Tax=Modestobacter sp. Leaf380 TaxID=1736356 RepID=UPI0006F908AC|nr:nucleotide exchange factor GrpE [Modestobacter sp. Leaf380]KQS63904.1 molecular chaperone GrpE [Modestobacter sp. Leaf380]
MSDRPQDEETPRVVIRDRRRIDPTSGQARQPAGASPADVPAGTAGPGAQAPGSDTPQHAPTATPGEQMSEQTGPEVDQPDAVATEVPTEQSAASTEQSGTSAEPQTEDARQLAERTEDLQRVSAEYANYRRRVDRDRALVVDQAAERFAGQLIPVVDDIERAREHGDLTGAFKVVADRVLGLLDGLGVTTFGAPGDPFDPALHEAVLHDSSAEVTVPTATTVLRPGFRRGERVLRTAMVGVTDPENPAPVAQPSEQAADGDQPAS